MMPVNDLTSSGSPAVNIISVLGLGLIWGGKEVPKFTLKC